MNVFITGGSRGIGQAIVLEAIRQGHEVAFTYHTSRERAEEVIRAACAVRPEARCQAYPLDVRNSDQVDEVGNQVLDDFDRVDAVICNAGINLNGLAANMPDETWQTVIDTNLTGSFFVARQFLPGMVANRSGSLVFVSSMGANGISGQAPYAASKAGLLGLSSTLAKEYGRRGIRSNAVLLGFIETDMTREGMSEGNRQFWITYNPLGRTGEPVEAARAILFLCSDAASFISGEAISVTGGLDWGP